MSKLKRLQSCLKPSTPNDQMILVNKSSDLSANLSYTPPNLTTKPKENSSYLTITPISRATSSSSAFNSSLSPSSNTNSSTSFHTGSAKTELFLDHNDDDVDSFLSDTPFNETVIFNKKTIDLNQVFDEIKKIQSDLEAFKTILNEIKVNGQKIKKIMMNKNGKKKL